MQPMRELGLGPAVDRAIEDAMARDESIVLIGEDAPLLRAPLFARFGAARILAAPISEAAFLGAAAGAAMAGLRPVVELYMVDFVAVAADALINHAAKVQTFSGGRWKAPMVVRMGCGGGYGDGGQHEQSLWGWLAQVPGLRVVVPSNPADAGGLMLSALLDEGPVLFLEHKLLADYWLDYLADGGRTNLDYDIPEAGIRGEVPRSWSPIPLGEAKTVRDGHDLTIATLGVSVHRALAAADELAREGVQAGVIDLRSVSPLDRRAVSEAVAKTGRLLVVDEDYKHFALSGELAAIVLEAGLHPQFARVCVEDTIPFDRRREAAALPNVSRIVAAAKGLAEAS